MVKPKLSIIISNRNDIVMLSITVRSCLEAFKTLGSPGTAEIVICDNSDQEAYDILMSALPSGYINEGVLTVIRQDFPCLFTAREKAAEVAKGEYILCLDSHMLVGHNMFLDLLNFMEERRDDSTLGFAHAPINWAYQHERASKHDRDISVHELGPWNRSYSVERTITWKGMPWICRRDWFLDRENGLRGYGALADHKVSWGGGDMHIGVKPWLLGYKNWAVPTSPGIHIGPFPKIDKVGGDSTKVSNFKNQDRYRLYAKSGEYPHTFGFLVSCYVLGGDEMIQRNLSTLKQRFGRYLCFDSHIELAKQIGQEEREWLLANQVMSFEDFIVSKPWEV